VFINGVELKGVFTPNAVSRAVDAIAAKNPPALTCENDQPPPATDKLIADWREQPTAMISPAHPAWPLGNPGGRIQIVIWGDLQESNSAQVDGIIRKFMTGRSDVEYSFRHFPVNQSCNPSCQVNKHEKACLAHKAAVAAGLIGGSDFYWKMHEWLFANAAQLSDETLKTNAFQMGLDVNRLLQMMNSPETAQYIESDAALGKRLGLNSIPTIYVNGKFVPRWSRDGVSVLDQILEEAARK
jgi:protein-disulfide isomerase